MPTDIYCVGQVSALSFFNPIAKEPLFTFGRMKLANVKASIVKDQRVPLLLGQSILKRLGKIDNEKRLLKITYKEKK